jgi:hypothetical protein
MERKNTHWHCVLFREFSASMRRSNVAALAAGSGRRFWTVWTPQTEWLKSRKWV